MIVTTTETVPNRTITATLGVVRGYTTLETPSENGATARLEAEASALGADAVVGVRFMTADDTEGAAEVLAYGTAVRLS